MASFLGPSFIPVSSFLESILLSLFALVITALALRHFLKPKLRLDPPSPPSVPIFGNWLQVGDNLNRENLSLMAKTYGPILLKMGQRNVMVVSSLDLAKEILHTQGVEFGSPTRNVVLDIFTGKGQEMVFTVYGDHWRKMRRIMTLPFFTNKVVQQSSVRWQEEIDSAIADLKANPAAATTGAVVIRHRLQLLMYNNMYGLMFNRRFEREHDLLFVERKKLNSERSRLAQSFGYNNADFVPILRPFLRGYLQLCQKVKNERLALFKKYFVDERKKALTGVKSFSKEKCAIDHILDAQKSGDITEENVLYILENINVAAIETTLWSIEWGLAEPVNNPDIQRRLRGELNTEVGYGVSRTEPDLPGLPYLLAVVKESMRLHMAIPLLVPHMNLQQGKLGGYDIPAERKILVNTWYLANNSEWWERPDVFNPDRFLGLEKIDASGNDFRFLPFGVGRRSCPGIILAMPIVSLWLGRFVQAFELSPPPGHSKADLAGKGSQFSLQIANHSVVVCKPLYKAVRSMQSSRALFRKARYCIKGA